MIRELEQVTGKHIPIVGLSAHALVGFRERCLAALRRALARASGGSEGPDLVVEVIPSLAGVAEAAAIMGWDKRRVITYIDRGRFPAPIQTLASGRVWLRADVVRFAEQWHARRAGRAGVGPVTR